MAGILHENSLKKTVFQPVCPHFDAPVAPTRGQQVKGNWGVNCLWWCSELWWGPGWCRCPSGRGEGSQQSSGLLWLSSEALLCLSLSAAPIPGGNIVCQQAFNGRVVDCPGCSSRGLSGSVDTAEPLYDSWDVSVQERSSEIWKSSKEPECVDPLNTLAGDEGGEGCRSVLSSCMIDPFLNFFFAKWWAVKKYVTVSKQARPMMRSSKDSVLHHLFQDVVSLFSCQCVS